MEIIAAYAVLFLVIFGFAYQNWLGRNLAYYLSAGRRLVHANAILCGLVVAVPTMLAIYGVCLAIFSDTPAMPLWFGILAAVIFLIAAVFFFVTDEALKHLSSRRR